MIEMVLVYCLAAAPAKCQEQRPVFEEPLTAMGCLIGAQETAQKWLAEHPDWQLSGWRCETGHRQRA